MAIVLFFTSYSLKEKKEKKEKKKEEMLVENAKHALGISSSDG